MNDTDTQSTLRRIRQDGGAHFRKPEVLLTLATVSFVLGISGPFDTIDTLGTGLRLLYWTLVVWLTYGLGAAIFIGLFGEDAAPRWGAIALAAPVAGLAVMLILLVLNYMFFGLWFETYAELVWIWGFASVVSFLVTALSALAYLRRHPEAPGPAAAPPLLRRLPIEKRGALVSLSVQDHYVQIVTEKGREMVLMRLRDAVDETAPQPGLQVHRSHWVATDHITALRRRGDGAVITTSAGDDIPVSRSYMKAVRANGLLPEPSARG